MMMTMMMITMRLTVGVMPSLIVIPVFLIDQMMRRRKRKRRRGQIDHQTRVRAIATRLVRKFAMRIGWVVVVIADIRRDNRLELVRMVVVVQIVITVVGRR